MDDHFAAIRAKLRHLRREATNFVGVFGSEAYGFRTHPPLAASEIGRFEAKHRIVLPTDYRGFLIQVGNGGAGPSYGLFKLGEIDQNETHGQWEEGDDMVGVLSSPFPHSEAWNDRTGEPEFDESKEDDEAWQDEYNRKLDEWEEKHYWDPALVNGAIPICHRGCALRQWLVVTGPEAGTVWNDDRADGGGLYPQQQGRLKRITFMAWYRAWLDEAVNGLPTSRGQAIDGKDSPEGAEAS